MSEIEQIRRNTEKAYQAALKAMFELVDAITEERNYYKNLCNKKKRSLDDSYFSFSQNIIKRFRDIKAKVKTTGKIIRL